MVLCTGSLSTLIYQWAPENRTLAHFTYGFLSPVAWGLTTMPLILSHFGAVLSMNWEKSYNFWGSSQGKKKSEIDAGASGKTWMCAENSPNSCSEVRGGLTWYDTRDNCVCYSNGPCSSYIIISFPLFSFLHSFFKVRQIKAFWI